jgi:phosphopantothenoylcysteine decarboxylase / phosphopantothenate---cysteine ligase
MEMSPNVIGAESTLPEDLAVEKRSSDLDGWHLAFCVSGGIAAIEAPRTIRELRRRGATVQVWASEKALQFVGRTSLEWASGRRVLIEPDGLAQHVATGITGVVVFPATSNVLGQMAQGLCTDGLATFLQSALGLRLPMVVFPAMHQSLSQSPMIVKNQGLLAQLPNVRIVSGERSEGKQKVPSPEMAALMAAHGLNALQNKSKGRSLGKAYVTGGGTRSSWDPVRCLTNVSTGRLGKSLCDALYARGVCVEFFKAQTTFEMSSIENLQVHDSAEFTQMQQHLAALKLNPNDGFFHLAAVSDFLIANTSESKISSAQAVNSMPLKPAPKLLLTPQNLVNCAFRFAGKLTTGTEAEGLVIAKDFLASTGYSACLWNHANALQAAENQHEGVLITRKLKADDQDGQFLQQKCMGKKQIAEDIAKMYLEALSKQQ